MTDHASTTSLWAATATRAPRTPLAADADADVVVVGAGVTGLATALRLVEGGRRVVVLEARDVAAGTTLGTTGKVTSQHGVIYAELAAKHGDDVARAYGHANQDAIAAVREVSDRHGIDAHLATADAFVYATEEDDVARLRSELATAQRLGLPATWSDRSELPFPVRGAVRFAEQLQLHAVELCAGMADAIERAGGGVVHTGTRVTDVTERDGRAAVTTEAGHRVTADHVVLATLAPITDRGAEFARMTPVRAYGIAAEVTGDAADRLPVHMHLAAGSPDRSVRTFRAEGRAWLVVVGASHEVGHETATDEHVAELEAFAAEHFGTGAPSHRWSAQDLVPDDRLPFVGATGLARRIHVATGFQKWGLSNAFVAADVLTATIDGRDHPLASALSPTRVTVRASAKRFARHNADVATRFVADRVRPAARSVEEVPRGDGATVRVDGALLAVHRGDDGEVTTRSAICSHLGCVVAWNRAERSWDCPCHGSRFDTDGQVLDGPSTAPLADAPTPGDD